MEEAKIKCLRYGNQEVAVSRHERGENYLLFGCDDQQAISPETRMAISVAICCECGEVAFLKAKKPTKNSA